ncbi:MAG TPA: ribosome maturation factor RimP [Syntrophobacteraceae bacterium]|nr:ribosome maturation factor RimP [Syntrophobacteraceae bacterium]
MTEEGNKTKRVAEQVWQLVEPVVRSEGFELLELEYRCESHGWVLRLYIDQEDGITVEDCAQVSRIVSDLLDVSDPIINQYHLEVSSPGLNRPLRKWEQFQKVIGSVVDVRTSTAIADRRRFKGKLITADPEGITVDCEGVVYDIPLSLLERARLRYFESLG